MPTTRPSSHTLSTGPSAGTNVYGRPSSRRVRNDSTAATSSAAITDTCDLESAVTPGHLSRRAPASGPKTPRRLHLLLVVLETVPRTERRQSGADKRDVWNRLD